MKVFICGISGYLGHSLACHLAALGHQVGGLDMGHRARWVEEMGSQSAIPVRPYQERCQALEEAYGLPVAFYPCDMRDGDRLEESLRHFQPEAVVHLAQMPAAPFSMIDRAHSVAQWENNTTGNLNLLWAVRAIDRGIHILKLGTMGEFGCPEIPIPEGVFPDGAEWAQPHDRGPSMGGDFIDHADLYPIAGLQFPRSPGSGYHASKCADSILTEMKCRLWGLRATDVMQGVVYGTRIDAMKDDPRLWTRFDFDESFGTAINRFCAQTMIGVPITPYGAGHQKRGFLPLRDSMQCLTLLLENPPVQGEYRTVNQIENVYDITEVAEKVAAAADAMGILEREGGRIQAISNPRKGEKEDHTYEVAHDKLAALGYEPTADMDIQISQVLADLEPHAGRIRDCVKAIMPTITWDK